jgi:hypothetical protein
MKSAAALLFLVACGSSPNSDVDAPTGTGDGTSGDGTQGHAIKTVFVIPMENKADAAIYGNTTAAPYINGLLGTWAHATNFKDELPSLDSEPHYIWMEAGTNAFTDHTFTTDNDSSASNSTTTTEHLATNLTTAGVPWTAYQQGITTNTCPIASSGNYAAKHDPFVFFTDVAGSPPKASTASCASHHKSYADLAGDLTAGTVSGYVFITPDLCNDMHGALNCPSGITSSPNIKAGDTWLSTELPRILAYANAHDGVVFLTWDEGDATNLIPFIALGSHVKAGATSATMYTHSSTIKTIEEMLGVPVMASVTSATDFADMFDPGTF